MMAERLAEIRELCKGAPWGSLPLVAELLDHIAQLEARPDWTNLSMAKAPSDPTLAAAYHDGYNDCATRAKAFYEARISQLEAQRGGAVVVPDDKFTLDLDESLDHKLARITINSEARGVGYDLCGRVGDGRFSRRTYDITPYIKHCLDTIGIQPIPADRVLAEGMVGVDREEWDLLGRLHMVAMQFVMDADPAQRRSAAHLVQAVAALRQYTGRAQQAKGE